MGEGVYPIRYGESPDLRLTAPPVDSKTELQSRINVFFASHLKPAFFSRLKRAPQLHSIRLSEDRMSTDLQYLEEWIPERMDPGTVFVLENQTKLGNAQNPYVAVMSCPRCGTMGLITRRQLCAGETMICGGETCSAEYRLDGENIQFRMPQ